MALKLTGEQLDWLAKRIPDHGRSPLGGRPCADKRRIIRGIFWILDNGAKWKYLPRRFGSKSTVHQWFQTRVREGISENIMREAGRCVEERNGFRLHESFIDGTFAKAKGGGTAPDAPRPEKAWKSWFWLMRADYRLRWIRPARARTKVNWCSDCLISCSPSRRRRG